MARLDHIDTYENSLYKRLYENMPTGFTSAQLINTDLGTTQTMSPPYLKQSTVTTVRNNSSAGGLTSRTYLVHTIQILVDKDKGAEKRKVSSIAKEIMALFENQYFDGLSCLEATPEKVGDEPGSNLFRYDININLYFEGN